VKLMEASTKQAGLVRIALEESDHQQSPEGLWQMALVSLRQQLRNLDIVRNGIRKLQPPAGARPALIRRILWPSNLEKRYRQVEEDLDDLMETLALGLSRPMRQAIDNSASDVERSR
jgi:hypothetical protein